jgi:hypothetical protein
MDLHNEISKAAYELYENSGKAEGRNNDNWFEAERIVMAQRRVEEKLEAEPSSPPKRKKKATIKRSINKAETKRKKN